MVPILLIAAGGFFGAVARVWLTGWMKKKRPSVFPWPTLAVNLSGSFLLGLLLGTSAGPDFRLFAGTGFLGAFTTFSTFKLENIQLHKSGKDRIMLLYLAVSYVCGILLAFAGYKAGNL